MCFRSVSVICRAAVGLLCSGTFYTVTRDVSHSVYLHLQLDSTNVESQLIISYVTKEHMILSDNTDFLAKACNKTYYDAFTPDEKSKAHLDNNALYK